MPWRLFLFYHRELPRQAAREIRAIALGTGVAVSMLVGREGTQMLRELNRDADG